SPPAYELEVVLSIYPELVGGPPIEDQVEPGDVGTGPFVEVFVVTPEKENVPREMGELGRVEGKHVIEVGDGRLAGERDRVQPADTGGHLESVVGVEVSRVPERLGEHR